MVVGNPGRLAGFRHHFLDLLSWVAHVERPREESPLAVAVVGWTGFEKDLEQPLGDLDPACPPATAASFHVLGTGEDARVGMVQVTPRPAKRLAESGSGLFEKDEDQTMLVPNKVEKCQYVLVGRRRMARRIHVE